MRIKNTTVSVSVGLCTNCLDLFGLPYGIYFSSLVFSGNGRSKVRKSDGVSFCIILKGNTVEYFSSLEFEPFTVAFSGLYLGGFFWWCESHGVKCKENRMIPDGLFSPQYR